MTGIGRHRETAGRTAGLWMVLVCLCPEQPTYGEDTPPDAMSPQSTSADSTITDSTSSEESKSRLQKVGGLPDTIVGAVSKANPVAATSQTVDMAKWMTRRKQLSIGDRNFGFTGLPIVFYTPTSESWSYGVRVQWADYQRPPYRYKLTFNGVRSTAGRLSLFGRLKVPRISGTGFGVRLFIASTRDVRARYYGLGNETEFDPNLENPDHADFIDENYYFYVLERPRAIMSLLRHLHGPVSMSVGFGLERSEIHPRGSQSFYLDDGAREGVIDGVTGFLSMTLEWDTRDDPTIPKRGSFHEWSYETSRNSLIGLFFEEIDFQRYTLTDSRYIPITERLNLANRVILEALKGSVPLYAFGEIGGSRRVKGVGGGDTLRGFDSQRFTDNIRAITNTELRYRLHTQRLKKQWLEWTGVFFVDSGQVSPGVSDLSLAGNHWASGFGLRLYWNADFVIRLDLAFGSEQGNASFKYRNIF